MLAQQRKDIGIFPPLISSGLIFMCILCVYNLFMSENKYFREHNYEVIKLMIMLVFTRSCSEIEHPVSSLLFCDISST